MFFFRASEFLHYYLFSRHRKGHGIHSPFIFDLVSRIFRNKINPDIVFKIERIRQKNSSDTRVIMFKDLGAGSERMDNKIRKVSEITSYSAIPRRYGILLSSLAAEFGKKTIIEFGTSVGISTMYLASGSPDSVVYTMEGSPSVAGIARTNFSQAELANIELLEGSFDDLLPKFRKEGIKPDLVFIDGNHKKEPVLRYFDEMAEIADDEALIIIDDIHNSPEMKEAWDIITSQKRVTATIDIFRMGLVFFRSGMSRFNYVVRY